MNYSLLMWVVCCAGFIAGRRNISSLALALSWFIGQAYYFRTGDNLALSEYFIADVGVLTVIYAKTIWRVGTKTYADSWHLFKGLFYDLTLWDRIIVGIFLLGVWPTYVIELHEYYKWWILYWFTATQFLSSIIEALICFFKYKVVKKERQTSADIIPFIRRQDAEPVFVLRTGDGGGGVRC